MGLGFCTSARVAQAMRLAVLTLATAGTTSYAQLVPSTNAASAPGAAVDPMERAKRQADNVMRWIKVHADKPRPAPVAPTPPPAPLAVKPVVPKAVALTTPPEIQKPEAAVPPPAEIPAPLPVVVPAPIAPVQAPVLAPPPPVEEEEEVPLKALAQEQPVIPRNVLASLNSPGKVMVQFMVETNGSVSNVQVLSSSRTQLNRPTIAAVTNWRFEPVKAPRVAQIEFAFSP